MGHPVDYEEPKPSDPKPPWKTWLVPVTTIVLSLATVIALGGAMANQINTIAKDFVPRGEIDAKLETLDVKISHVQAGQLANSEQSARQYREIIHRIELLDAPTP